MASGRKKRVSKQMFGRQTRTALWGNICGRKVEKMLKISVECLVV